MVRSDNPYFLGDGEIAMSHHQSLLGGVKPGLPLIENGHHLNPSAVSYSERFIDDTTRTRTITKSRSQHACHPWHSGLKT